MNLFFTWQKSSYMPIKIGYSLAKVKLKKLVNEQGERRINTIRKIPTERLVLWIEKFESDQEFEVCKVLFEVLQERQGLRNIAA